MQDVFKKWGRYVRLLAPILLVVTYASPVYSASKTVLVLGDSLSAEYGLVRGTGWVHLLQKKLQEEKIDATIVNASISGETTIGGRTRLPSLLKKQQPQIVVIELGANDALRGLSLNATEDNLRNMIVASQKAKSKVLLVGMQIPPNYGAEYTQKFSSLFPSLAKETKSALVPFFLEGLMNNPDLFQSDRLHPSAAAQPTMLNNVWHQLKPLLGK